MLRHSIRAVMGDSAGVLRYSRYLALGPISGGSDGAGLVTTVLVGGIALCAECIAEKTGIPLNRIDSTLLMIGQSLRVQIDAAPCDARLKIRTVYRLE